MTDEPVESMWSEHRLREGLDAVAGWVDPVVPEGLPEVSVVPLGRRGPTRVWLAAAAAVLVVVVGVAWLAGTGEQPVIADREPLPDVVEQLLARMPEDASSLHVVDLDALRAEAVSGGALAADRLSDAEAVVAVWLGPRPYDPPLLEADVVTAAAAGASIAGVGQGWERIDGEDILRSHVESGVGMWVVVTDLDPEELIALLQPAVGPGNPRGYEQVGPSTWAVTTADPDNWVEAVRVDGDVVIKVNAGPRTPPTRRLLAEPAGAPASMQDALELATPFSAAAVRQLDRVPMDGVPGCGITEVAATGVAGDRFVLAGDGALLASEVVREAGIDLVGQPTRTPGAILYDVVPGGSRVDEHGNRHLFPFGLFGSLDQPSFGTC